MEPNQIILHEISIVIVGKTHNPSILNPDFLRHNNIVPKEMKTADGPAGVVSTLVGARIAYKDGLVITGDLQRIVFTESIFEKKAEDIVAPGAAKTYLRTVPHVRYTAVGVNPEGHARVSDGSPSPQPASLLRNEARTDFKGSIPSAEIELKYAMQRKTITMGIAVADVDAPVDIDNAVVFRGNFHRVLDDAEQDSFQKAISAVQEWEEDLNDFRLLAEQIKGDLK